MLLNQSIVERESSAELNMALAEIERNFLNRDIPSHHVPEHLRLTVSEYCLYVILNPDSVSDVIGNAVDCAPEALQYWFHNCRIDSLEVVETLAKQLHDLNWMDNVSVGCHDLLSEFADLCEFMLGVGDPQVADFFYAEIQKISSKYSVYY